MTGTSFAAPITYDLTGSVAGNQALGGSHIYTAVGGPNLTAISGSTPIPARVCPRAATSSPRAASWLGTTVAPTKWVSACASGTAATTATSTTIPKST